MARWVTSELAIGDLWLISAKNKENTRKVILILYVSRRVPVSSLEMMQIVFMKIYIMGEQFIFQYSEIHL